MKRLLAVFLVLIPLMASCSQVDKVIKPSAEGLPYDTLGIIEVTQPAKHNILVRILTFGALKYRSYERIKTSLNAEMVRKAKMHYKAESIINVKYWPDAELAKATEVYHARGEMIRYQRFGDTSPTAAAVPPIEGR